MVGTTREVGDTDYDSFAPDLSPVSLQSNDNDRINTGVGEDGQFNFYNDNCSLLGVIVDRSSFDEDDELTTFGRDAYSIYHKNPMSLNMLQHQQLGLDLPIGGVVMRNGKVRRRMRWKPRFGKKKSSSNHFSSNASVVSALTNRSSATSSTTRSFLSHFSRKSNTSFHTFNSTETPVATNKANRPQAPHTVMRPNYQDSFDTKPTTSKPKYSTIDTEGSYPSRQRTEGFSVSSSSGFLSTKLDSVIESSPSEDVENNTSSTPIPDSSTKATLPLNVRTSSNNSVGAGSTASTVLKGSPLKPPIPLTIKSTRSPSQPHSKPKRPPLFKRRLRHGKNKTSSNFNSNSNNSQNVLSPTDTNSTASLSSAISLERENSGLPVLLGDDEQDRRIQIEITRSLSVNEDHSRTKSLLTLEACKLEDDSEGEKGPEENSVSPTEKSSVSDSQSADQSSQSASSPVLSRNTTPSSLQKRIASITKKHSTSSTSISTATPKSDSTGSPPSPAGASGNQSPVVKRSIKNSVPCNLDEGAFMEAEHNLRAIHDMAAEHLAHGEYEEAADVFEEILRGQQERYGQDHYRVGIALHNLGIVYLKKKDYEKAIEICRRAVDVRKDSLVPNHPDVAVSLAQLGVAHLESKNYHQALAAFRDALNIRRNFLGPRHAKCSKILNNIGCALYSIEDLPEAKRAFDEALEIHRDGLRSLPTIEGSESNGMQGNTLLLSMASTLCNIGSIRLRWGDFEKAEIALEESLLIQQSVLGDDHPTVSSTIDSIEVVETAKYMSENPLSHHNFLINQAAAACTAEDPTHVMAEILGFEKFTDMLPKNWFANPWGPVASKPKEHE